MAKFSVQIGVGFPVRVRLPVPLVVVSPGPIGPTVLSEGSRGPAVRSLQEQLVRTGYLASQPDGKFGPATKKAVVDFQAAAGMKADGLVGPKTLDALKKAPSKAGPFIAKLEGADRELALIALDRLKTAKPMEKSPALPEGQKVIDMSTGLGAKVSLYPVGDRLFAMRQVVAPGAQPQWLDLGTKPVFSAGPA